MLCLPVIATDVVAIAEQAVRLWRDSFQKNCSCCSLPQSKLHKMQSLRSLILVYLYLFYLVSEVMSVPHPSFPKQFSGFIGKCFLFSQNFCEFTETNSLNYFTNINVSSHRNNHGWGTRFPNCIYWCPSWSKSIRLFKWKRCVYLPLRLEISTHLQSIVSYVWKESSERIHRTHISHFPKRNINW